MAGGDFTPEAYEQLREAYAKESQDAKSIEERGHDIMGLNLGLETAPVDSPWASLIPNDQYPSGKSEYIDGKQDPAEILELMRNSVALPEVEEEEVDEEEEEEILSDEDEVEEEEEEEEEDEDEEDDEDEDEDDEDEDDDEDDDEEEEEDDSEDDDDDDEIEPVDDADVEVIAAQIAELRAEIEQMQFVPETNDDEPE